MNPDKQLRSADLVAAVGVGGLAAYALILRPWHLRWGATREEARRPMPGDELVHRPFYVSNRAITIRARPEEIWPWLVQIGMGRGGFYSYEWLERLAGLSISTVEHLLPEFQTLEPGEVIPTGRGLHLPVRAVEPYGSLVIGSRPEEPPGTARVSWSLGLYPGDGSTRLVSRVRTSYFWRPGDPLIALFLGPLHFLMERKMLLGIKRRAEALDARLAQDTEVPGVRTGSGPRAPGAITPEQVTER
jgi:hypothetical protein